MLSLSEVPYCESAVRMKTRLNCHESARMSAATATGSIGSIFDVSMGRGGRQQEADSGRAVEGFRGCVPLRSSRHRPWGGAPSNFCMGISEVNTSGHPVPNLHQPWTTARATLAKIGTPYQSITQSPPKKIGFW